MTDTDQRESLISSSCEEYLEEEEEIDPFSHRIQMSRMQWIRTYILTFVLLPVKIVSVLLLVTLAWAVSWVSVMGLSEEEKTQKPLEGWRRQLRRFLGLLGRVAMLCAGFIIRVRGRQATSKEAPILVAAPHSTFFDAFASFYSHSPYIVSRVENKSIPLLGKCIEVNQALFVCREDPDSRHKTIDAIKERANSSQNWPQLILFPEGSTSNRRALMKFKVGAFLPQKPVQPVVIRYPNEIDTVTWTWNQDHGAKSVLWLTLSQPFVKADLQFLPVYYPNEQEIEDPALYARNVRDVMAAALGIPVSDGTFEEAKAKFGKKKKKRRFFRRKSNKED